MDTPISRAEHDEFAKRMEEEHRRQNKRIDLLEKSVENINNLTVSVRELATNMKNMSEELQSQGEKLETLESRDGEMWRKVTSYIVTAVVGAVVCYIMTRIGM